MLGYLRKRKRSWVVVFFIAVISLVFTLYFGTGSFQGGPVSDTIAEVNGEPITAREFEVQYLRVAEAYRNLFRETVAPDLFRSLNLRSGVLDDLIQRRLLLQEARGLGLRASDEELMEAVASSPAFQIEGRFNKRLYLRVLRSRRLTPTQFERERREELVIQKVQSLIRDSVRVSENELRERYRRENEKVNLTFIRLAAKDFMEEIQIGEEDLQDYYNRNKELFREPVKVQVEYIAYPFSLFSSQVELAEKEIQDYYDLHSESRFHQAKAVRLRHIFFRLPSFEDAKKKKEVRGKAEEVLRLVQAGEDFAQLATEHSEDRSASEGGKSGL